MTIDTTARSPAFEDLLLVNPWARDHWSDRLEMIEAGTWNINHVNQAGNEQTKAWLNRFAARRVAETQARLLGAMEADDSWMRAISDVVRQVFNDPALAATMPGTPMEPISDGRSRISYSDFVAGYAPGQFLADVLLLAQPSLRDSKLQTALDISGRVFPIGPDFVGAHFEGGLTANKTAFGPLTDMSTARFGNASFQNAIFHGVTDWTLCQFGGDTSFTGAHFRRWTGFDAAIFGGIADFSGARFDDSAHFAGTVFAAACRLDHAYFADSTTFEHSQFKQVPSLDGVKFMGAVSIVGVGKPAVKAIAAVSQPASPFYQE